MQYRGPRTVEIPQMPRWRPPRIDGRRIAIAVAVVVGLFALVSSAYQIEPEEVGVVVRFGAYSRTTDPGLHFKLPAPIERVYKVPVQRQLKQEFGFRTERPGVRTSYDRSGFESESLMLTGDLNVAVVEWTTQYRVADPYLFLFKVRNVEKTFRDMNEAVMRSVIGDRSVNEVITVGRQEIAETSEVLLQEMCTAYENGIRVEQVVLQDVNPPDPVKPSFNEVNQAEQERERAINEARAEYNRVIPRARGEAERTVQQAEGYAVDRVNRAEGDAAAFVALYEAYRKAPDVTRRRLYLEAMADVLPKAERKIVIDDGLEGILPLLRLDAATGGAQ